ncbi:type II toxin-antitoxin system PemK/MazF family toxin [Xanthobacter autotrophicus]|uniref:type II toxin-antitoxin system PemK/MazF family toxin n=1 Tax=Xanthobacter autotrophicus TaxID=280 RepID=UPI001E4AAB7D|nr:type II toxin-antitoxin system PemK/MazF family toxin [Xanthobacter autotrophicus]UDQ89656.1 type II toxin-antitoxin system PemK/MazF family toxin [Xanthobacter autotrophicus]
MRRGDIVLIALPGAYGKPRPALVIQSDLFEGHPSVTVLPITSDLRDAPLFRIGLDPTPENGLRLTSEIMVDKAHTVPRDKIGVTIGRASDADMLRVTQALALFLGFA